MKMHLQPRPTITMSVHPFSSVIAREVEISISETAEFYKDELSSPNLLDEEFRR